MTQRPRNTHSAESVIHSVATLDADRIDELYGLEPVFEPETASPALGAFVEIQCPWCGEVSGTTIDLTTADRHYIEDCQVCCNPMELAIDVDDRGELRSVTTRRSD